MREFSSLSICVLFLAATAAASAETLPTAKPEEVGLSSVSLLPYNPSASAKYEWLRLPFEIDGETQERDRLDHLLEMARERRLQLAPEQRRLVLGCLLALATHIHRRRDMSYYVDALERLEMPTVALSLGIEDYLEESHLADYTLDPTVRRLLEIVSERSSWIGVRGPHSAVALIRNGFRNVVPVGCPSVYSPLRPDHRVEKAATFERPLCVYHRSLVEAWRGRSG